MIWTYKAFKGVIAFYSQHATIKRWALIICCELHHDFCFRSELKLRVHYELREDIFLWHLCSEISLLLRCWGFPEAFCSFEHIWSIMLFNICIPYRFDNTCKVRCNQKMKRHSFAIIQKKITINKWMQMANRIQF